MVCELPYDGNDVSMSIVLPNRGTNLSEIEEKIDLNFIEHLINATKTSQKVNIHLPKFKLEYKNDVDFFKLKIILHACFFLYLFMLLSYQKP